MTTPQDSPANVEVRNHFGRFQAFTTALGEHELGWRAYLGLTYEDSFPKSALRERYYNRRRS